MTGDSFREHLDVVYLHRESRTDAFKYSLRTLQNVSVGRVVVVGDKPSWMTNVTHIPFNFGPSKILNVWGQILKACEVVDEFLLFNDDFFVLQPLKSYEYYKGDITRRPSVYFNAYLRTKELFSGFKNFEVHAPMFIESAKFKALQDYYDITEQYLHRSLYGNHYQLQGEYVEDNKIRSIVNIREGFKRPFASTTNHIERHPTFISQITKLFPNKSIYEADNIH